MQLSILLRIPGWTEGEFNLQIDGIKQKAKVEKGFINSQTTGREKTSILLDLPMEINMITSNPMVRENTYKIAIERGPLVYCAEGRDNEGFSVWALSVPVKRGYDVQMNEELPGGYVTISGKGIAYDLDEWEGALYKPLAVVKNRGRNVRFTLYRTTPGTTGEARPCVSGCISTEGGKSYKNWIDSLQSRTHGRSLSRDGEVAGCAHWHGTLRRDRSG